MNKFIHPRCSKVIFAVKIREKKFIQLCQILIGLWTKTFMGEKWAYNN